MQSQMDLNMMTKIHVLGILEIKFNFNAIQFCILRFKKKKIELHILASSN